MSNLGTDIDNLKKKYREIFLETGEEFNLRLQNIAPEDLLKFLNEEIVKEVYEKRVEMLDKRKNYSCSGCASCCKLACSEFSYSELVQKVKEGDNFSSQFLSVFVPYQSQEEARDVYPEYFELLKTKVGGENTYFYHCPKVTKNNRCPDYDNRPQICRDFPDNPIGFLPKNCGFSKWREDEEFTALRIHAIIEIVEFYKKKIKE